MWGGVIEKDLWWLVWCSNTVTWDTNNNYCNNMLHFAFFRVYFDTFMLYQWFLLFTAI